MAKLGEAIACYRQALHAKPDFGPAWGNLGVALRTSRQTEAAIASLRRALLLQPAAPDLLNNLGLALRTGQQHAEAITCFTRALGHAPGDAEIRLNLGNTFREAGRPAEAADALREAIRLRPDFAEAHWDLAFALLLQGDFPSGFEEYEWRWRRPDNQPRQLTAPLWRGENPAGRRLLVYAEQGAGDAIQFVRFVRNLAERGARVVLECPTALAALFATVEGAEAVVCRGAALPECDWQVPLLSLAHRLGVTLGSIPNTVPYLRPPRERRLGLSNSGKPGGRLKVGIVWQGNPQHENDRQRSLPFGLLESVLSLPGVAFYSLQVPAAPEGARPSAGGESLIDLSGLIHDFADTAALVSQLDLVISVDTSVAHLAGALGRPVWLLLPFAPDWRWLLGRNDSPWYPTARLFRQPAAGDWRSVLQEVREALLAGRP